MFDKVMFIGHYHKGVLEMTEDRRVKHSKARIQTAMIDCLFQVSLDKVTVKMICDVADLNRSTFYAHYSDPLAVYEWIERETVKDMTGYVINLEGKKFSYFDLLNRVLEYASMHKRTILALLKTNSAAFKQINMEFLQRQDIWDASMNESDKSYAEEYHYSGMQSVICKWLSEGERESVGHMAALIFGLTNLNQLGSDVERNS